MNLPVMLCFHNSARILTALINISGTRYYKRQANKSAYNIFARKSISV